MSLFDLGQSLYHQGEFLRALDALENFCGETDANDPNYIEALLIRLRIYLELEETEKRLQLIDEITPHLATLGKKGLATHRYLLGYQAITEDKAIEALQLFEEALSFALEGHCLFTLAQALFGCVQAAYQLNSPPVELAEKIKQLEIITQQIQRTDLQISVLLLKANQELAQKNNVRAIDYAWKAYDLVKVLKNHHYALSVTAKIGHIYLESGDNGTARIYLNLAHRMIDPVNFKRLARVTENLLRQVGDAPTQEFDLILDMQKKVLIERHNGMIELKNQFILMDLMKLLMSNPGVPFSKEDLAEKLWQQKYNPTIHDNGIYVTIKRIRTLIEPNPQQHTYILRSRDGYLLSKDTKISIL